VVLAPSLACGALASWSSACGAAPAGATIAETTTSVL